MLFHIRHEQKSPPQRVKRSTVDRVQYNSFRSFVSGCSDKVQFHYLKAMTDNTMDEHNTPRCSACVNVLNKPKKPDNFNEEETA